MHKAPAERGEGRSEAHWNEELEQVGPENLRDIGPWCVDCKQVGIASRAAELTGPDLYIYTGVGSFRGAQAKTDSVSRHC